MIPRWIHHVKKIIRPGASKKKACDFFIKNRKPTAPPMIFHVLAAWTQKKEPAGFDPVRSFITLLI
jgi:hypothetical protein